MKNKTLRASLFIVLAMPMCNNMLYADETTDSTNHQFENLQESTDKIDDQQTSTLLEHSTKNKDIFIDQPLGERKHGIELNLFRLISWGEEYGAISGSYSYFDTKRNVEWAVPFFYAEDDEDLGWGGRSSSTSTLTLDIHYRQYLGHRLNGLYLAGFARAAHINSFSDPYVAEYSFKRGKATKLGAGVGIGWRKISQNNVYWGMSVSVGRYVHGQSDKFDSDFTPVSVDDNELILDVEFLKFGYAF